MRKLFLLLFLAPIAVLASERAEVCAKPDGRFGEANKTYQVEATIARGSELNQATGTWDYDGFATYVVIFWDRDQATIIQLESAWLGAFPVAGVDQQGRGWKVTKSSICY